MIEKLDVRILVNNCVNESGLWAEHGLSLLISFVDGGEERKILLDTGQTGDVFSHNLEVLKINLDSLVAIVISHGHYDHTGGLLDFLETMGRKVPVILHPDVWHARLNTKPYFRSIGSNLTPGEIEKSGGAVIEAANPVSLTDEIQTSGTIERIEPLEENYSFLRVRNRELVNDEILDDLSIIINLGEQGLFLATGCCHAGIINTVKHAMKLTGINKIKGVIGGLHLIGAGKERLQKTANYLEEVNPEMIVPLHCTGLKESSYLQKQLGDTIKFMGVGEMISVL